MKKLKKITPNSYALSETVVLLNNLVDAVTTLSNRLDNIELVLSKITTFDSTENKKLKYEEEEEKDDDDEILFTINWDQDDEDEEEPEKKVIMFFFKKN